MTPWYVRKERFWHWLADKIPGRVRYYCAINVMAYATTGKYSDTIVPELAGIDALKRFSDDKLR